MALGGGNARSSVTLGGDGVGGGTKAHPLVFLKFDPDENGGLQLSALQMEEYSGEGYLVQFVASGFIGGADTDCAGTDVPGCGGSNVVKKEGMSVSCTTIFSVLFGAAM